MKKLLFIITLLALAACTGNSYRPQAFETLKEHGAANPELQKLYDACPRGDKCFEAACFILANLEGKYSVYDRDRITRYVGIIDSMQSAGSLSDLADRQAATRAARRNGGYSTSMEQDTRALNADSVRASIEESFAAWENAPWHSQYTKEQFYEYVLPYRIANEPLEYYWKRDCLTRFPVPADSCDDVVACARVINSAISFRGDPLLFGAGVQGYSMMLRTNMGKCDDRSIITAMALRAHGIPAACELVPFWGTTNNGHSFCSVILPNGKCLGFNSEDENNQSTYLAQKAPKIYRRMFSIQDGTILYKMREKEEIPQIFSYYDLLDVTALHGITCSDIKIDLSRCKTDNRIAWLALFSPCSWNIVAYAENKGANTLFTDMGTGTDGHGECLTLGENIGDGILYMPCFYVHGEVIPVANPIIHSDHGDRAVVADTVHRQAVTLTRKYPRLQRIVNYAGQMSGGIFEGAMRADFSDARELYYVVSTPLSRMQRVEVSDAKPCRAVRFRKPKGALSIGEMRFFDPSGRQINGKPTASSVLADDPGLAKVFDGDPLTFLAVSGMLDGWVGVRFDRPEVVAAIEFCPRTDDNDISPGDSYELFYWQSGGAGTHNPMATQGGEWVSLGRQTAASHELVYSNAPAGALLWLRDLTRGREERPFTYENGGQVWW